MLLLNVKHLRVLIIPSPAGGTVWEGGKIVRRWSLTGGSQLLGEGPAGFRLPSFLFALSFLVYQDLLGNLTLPLP